MSILDNVAYGLMVKGMAKGHARAREALEKVALGLLIIASPPSSPAASGSGSRLPALVNQPRCCCSMSRWAPQF